MLDYTHIIVALISSITTLLTIYLTWRLNNKPKKQKITSIKSNCYIELDKICAFVKDNVKAQGVYIAYFHNGGHFINGVDMDKYTVIAEDYESPITSYKRNNKDIMVNNFPYLFHDLIVRNRHYIDDIEEHNFQDRAYKDELKNRNIKSAYSFIIKDPVKDIPIGFISIEYTEAHGFNQENEKYIWKKQNDIANLLNMKS